MTKNEEKLVKLIGNRGFVSLRSILSNLKVLTVKKDDVGVSYFVTRNDKNIPWPAPYEAGREIDGQPYYCCSYSTMDEEEWPEDTKQLTVYRVYMED